MLNTHTHPLQHGLSPAPPTGLHGPLQHGALYGEQHITLQEVHQAAEERAEGGRRGRGQGYAHKDTLPRWPCHPSVFLLVCCTGVLTCVLATLSPQLPLSFLSLKHRTQRYHSNNMYTNQQRSDPHPDQWVYLWLVSSAVVMEVQVEVSVPLRAELIQPSTCHTWLPVSTNTHSTAVQIHTNTLSTAVIVT